VWLFVLLIGETAVNKRRHEFEEDTDADLDELSSRYSFRNPNEKKRNRHANDTPLSKGKRSKQKHAREFD
jgi:hypothetical protein